MKNNRRSFQTLAHQAWPLARWVLTLAVLLTITAAATGAIACPTCKEGLGENDPVAQAMARGYFYSILFMMAMPFVIITTFGSAAYFSIRRARKLPVNASPKDA